MSENYKNLKVMPITRYLLNLLAAKFGKPSSRYLQDLLEEKAVLVGFDLDVIRKDFENSEKID